MTMADGNRPLSSDQEEPSERLEAAASSAADSSSNSTVLADAPSNYWGASTSTGSREENPFSFRHFLRRAQNPPVSHEPTRSSDEEHEARRFGGARPKTNSRRTRTAENEMKSPCGLPDFVQDHLVVEHDLGNSRASDNHQHVPELSQNLQQPQVQADSPLDLPRSQSPIHAAGAMPIPLDLANLASSNVDLANLNASSSQASREEHGEMNVEIPHEINNNENVNSLSQLPDFLSDGPMNQQRQQQDPVEEEPSPPSHSESSLIEENARLRQQLEISVSNEVAALARIQSLELLLEENRRREVAETSTLEKALEQVENNWRLTQQRALQAENQVAQLKKENRRLQDEVNLLVPGNSASASFNRGGLGRTAQELKNAAATAERSIRELLVGVDHLRLIASTLETMDRVDEIRPKRNTEDQ